MSQLKRTLNKQLNKNKERLSYVKPRLLELLSKFKSAILNKYGLLKVKTKAFFDRIKVQSRQLLSSLWNIISEFDLGAVFVIMVLLAFTNLKWYNCVVGGIGIFYLYLSIRYNKIR